MVTSMKRAILLVCSVMLMLLLAPATTLAAGPFSPPPASGQVIYDSTVSPLPPSLPSLGFQATQTAEFGDLIQFAGSNRKLGTVTVTMVTWAPHSDWPTMSDSGWTHPITLNIYSVDNSGAVPATGSLLATKTIAFNIPWRPAANPGCSGGQWMDSDGICHSGYSFNITFDMSDLAVSLPDQVIFGIAYNTETWGNDPIGTPGPYDSLNVGLNNVSGPSVGTDVDSDALFWNTETAGNYSDGGTGGVGTFRQDTNWSPYVPAVQFTTESSGIWGWLHDLFGGLPTPRFHHPFNR
jgi:hypothetical protein